MEESKSAIGDASTTIECPPNGSQENKFGKGNLLKALGPGILVACAAIGGSHLVWSTRAGAEFGWSLVWLIILANLLKMPFFLYGQRYTAATGESLLAGYQRQGNIYVWIFLAVNILTGVINIAGVSMLSGALFNSFGFFDLSLTAVTIWILAICAAMILFGHYRLLDGTAKVVMIILTLITILAVALISVKSPEIHPEFVPADLYTWASVALLISILGWMPAPIDLSAWSSLWIFSRQRQTGHFATPRETQIDFYIGYILATFLALLFLALGALVMYGTGERFDGSGVAFSNQLVSLYTGSIGDWARPIILTAAFITMVSTTITCVDGYPRSLSACCILLFGKAGNIPLFRRIQIVWMILSILLAIVFIIYFVQNLLQLLAFAALVSFLTSPVLAWINFKVMNGDNVPLKYRPGKILTFLSWAGFLFFAVMIIFYILSRFMTGEG